MDWKTARLGQSLYGTRAVLQPAPGGPIRLRQYQRDIVARVDQPRQRLLGELGRPGED